MNEFEHDPQSKTMDIKDSAIGFIVSFGFFFTIFIIAAAAKLIG